MKILLRILFWFSLFTTLINATEIIDVNKKIAQAKNEKKMIMFFFHVPNCQYCKAMLNENFTDKKVKSLIKEHFIFIDIYTADKKDVILKNFKGTPSEFGRYMGAYAYPATLFMKPDETIVHKAIAYRNLDEFLIEMKYITTKSYKEMDLDAFKLKMELEEDE